ncbi:hypothetical protein H0H81_008521 [Sphagnurus paluster]|uniref:Secreted protein n=1 Tax=Sphagnurus paluster TaxID=117069 RepID=A0A9P7FWC4_9AGAR|nr:hypothetical protein H0H81_008521 [Sphagnurus paluster]
MPSMFATYLTNLLIWMLASVRAKRIILSPPHGCLPRPQQNIIEIPVGFAVAMSCVLGNRIILNVRSVNKEERATRASEKPLSHAHNRSRSVVLVQSSEKSLSEIEMGQLRSMRAGM